MNFPRAIKPVPKYNHISAKMVIFNKIFSTHQLDVRNLAIANQLLLLLGAEKKKYLTASKCCYCHILLSVSYIEKLSVWLESRYHTHSHAKRESISLGEKNNKKIITVLNLRAYNEERLG